jgi:alkylated DNA repair dioxygenase AlkB
MKRYAITFGEVAILHVGSTELGKRRNNGFTIDELMQLNDNISESEFISLSDKLPSDLREENEAGVLIIRNAADLFLGKNSADKLLHEQDNIQYDKKYFDNRRKKTLNKRARYNIVFGEQEVLHSDDYKTFSIKAFQNLPYLNQIKNKLHNILGDKANNLNAEGNYYYEKQSGIGFHGDAERKIVICLSLGNSSTLRYAWRMPKTSEHYGESIDIQVNHGDMYIMSEKATGFDWKLRSKVRIVHAAGSNKYIIKK